MGLKGKYIRGDGLILPNNVTLAGAAFIMAAALQNSYAAIYMGLVQAVPDVNLLESACIEPTIGTNGYARQLINRNNTDWATTGIAGVEAWIKRRSLRLRPAGVTLTK